MRRAVFVFLVCWFGASSVTACLYDYGDYDFEDETNDTSSPARPSPTVQTPAPSTATPLIQADAGVSPG